VEILTAVAIIAILVSMAFLGFKYASAGPKASMTQATLMNCRGALSEFESQMSGRVKDLLAPYTDTTKTPAAMPALVTSDVLDPDNLHKYNIVPPPTPPVAAYGAQYYDIYVTAYEIMPRLRAIPANKAVFDALPTDHVYPRRFVATKDPNQKPPYSAGDMRTYQTGERVQSGNGFYICTTGYPVSEGTPLAPEADTGHWKVDRPNFLVLDAWGSPIIFVPPAGAAEMYEGGDSTDPKAVRHVTGGSGLAAPKQAPDRKGYFMSAGPDRNFANGDDNIYSFENK
jgi:type II secretory pathway pseudopilin PulG